MRIHEPTDAEKYIESLYAFEDAGLRAVRERLIAAGRWGVNIGAAEGKILQVLLRLTGAARVVEIGTLFGYSAVWIARALPESGRLFTIERDHDCVRLAKKAFDECGVAPRVTILEGDATDLLGQLNAEGPFDAVFIDANKSAYPEYLTWAAENVRSKGLIVADNTLLAGGVALEQKPDRLSRAQYAAMREFNRIMATDPRFFATILPTTEGLSVAQRT